MKKVLSIAIALMLLLGNVCALSDSITSPVYDLAIELRNFTVGVFEQYSQLNDAGYEFDSELVNRLYEYIVLYIASQNMLIVETDNLMHVNDDVTVTVRLSGIEGWGSILDRVNGYYSSYCKGETDIKAFVDRLLALTKAFTGK